MADKNQIGAFMASLRKERDLTQAELAERLNVSNKSISRWENGQTLPDYDQVLELCAIFEISATEFLRGGPLPDAAKSTPQRPEAETAQEEPAIAPAVEKPTKRRNIRIIGIATAVALLAAALIVFLAVRSSRRTWTAVDAQSFPDESLRTLIERQIPHRHKGYLTEEELLAVKTLDCSRAEVADLTGIGLFENLEELNCSENAIETIDLSRNRALVSLDCSENRLTALDVSGNPDLRVLKCNDNAIEGLDVTQNPALVDLQCYCNPIGSIDVTNNPALEKLDAWQAGFTKLDVSNNPKLTYLNCDYGGLIELDLSGNPDITVLYCAFNQLTSLDVSNLTGLVLLSCGNNRLETLKLPADMPIEILLCDKNRLTKLDLSAYTKLTYCICDDNPITELTLAQSMPINAADADRFRIAETVMIGPYKAESDGNGGYRFDLSAFVSPEHLDRVTVRTREASQPDENGTVTFAAVPRELVYVFDTGFRHIGFEVRVILDTP